MKKPTLREERALQRQGYAVVAGIDEAGRGAWAGPVVAAAVILPPDGHLSCSVRDSKLLSPKQRSELYPVICADAAAWSVGQASHMEIDTLGIVSATRLAMQRAVEALKIQPDVLLIDALKLPQVPLPQRALYRADQLCVSVAAASILAKVTRDRLMVDWDAQYPGYGFAQHKAYGTLAHRQALAKLGVSPIHRQTFRPVTEIMLKVRKSALM